MGSADGVLSTRSVWVGDREVVHVTYDSAILDYEKLLDHAAEMECMDAVYTHRPEQKSIAKTAGVENLVEWQDSLETRQVKKSEQKYYLRKTLYGHLPLTEWQAVQMNVALSKDDKAAAEKILSPRQRTLLAKIRACLAEDPTALKGIGFPENETDLPEYHRKLKQRLAECATESR